MPKTFKFFKWSGKKAVAFCVLTVVLALAIVGATLAIIIDVTDSITNTFPPAKVEVSITGDDITNVGDTAVYVRATVVVTWVNTTDGTTLSTTPVQGIDYTITYNTAGNWAKAADGFWYLTVPVAANATAPALINNITQTTMEGYTLTVQVLSSAIQATPTDAVLAGWATGVSSVNANGVLQIKQ